MPEGDYNVLSLDFVNKLRKQMAQGGAAGGGAVPQIVRAQPPQEFARRAVILVNDESTDVPPGGCLAITDTYASGYGPIFLKCVQPSTTFRRDHTFAPLTGLAANGQCLAQDGPHYYALYNSGTPANGEGYGPTPGQYYLTKNYPETSICHGVWDSTAKIMLATLGVIERVVGKTAGAATQNGTATVNVYQGTAGSETIITSMTIASVTNKGPAIASGIFVWVFWVDGLPYMEPIDPYAGNPSTDVDNLSVAGEGSETADTATHTSSGANGVKVKLHTRSVYNNSGDEKLYGYQREFIFDKEGRLYSISAETRYEIDAPEDC